MPTIIYLGHKSDTWLGLCSDSPSVFRSHQLGQFQCAESDLREGSLTCLSGACCHPPGAQRGSEAVALPRTTSPQDSLCFPTAQWMGSKNKCSRTEGVEAANLFIFLRFYLFTFRQNRRMGEREGEKHHCEKHQSVASHMHPDWGPNPQSRHGPWNQISDLPLCRVTPNQLSHTGQGRSC